METSDYTKETIDRLLKTNLNQANNDSTDDSKENNLNLTQEQFELLANLYNIQNEKSSQANRVNDFKTFLPEAGFCLKTKTDKNEKVFLNICISNEIAAPKNITEDELLKIIEQNDSQNAAFQFRVPMSLADPHSELDNNSEPCCAYDICINTEFFEKILKISTFMGFFMSIVIEGLESKYNIKLDRNCKMLKNKKYMGKIREHHIRIKSKPLIAEMNASNQTVDNQSDKKSVQEIKSENLKYKIYREPIEGPVEFIVAEVELPKIISAKSLMLDIGEDRILLTSRSGLYNLDIYLPFKMNQDEAGAQFDKKTKILTITIPVLV